MSRGIGKRYGLGVQNPYAGMVGTEIECNA